MEACEPTSHLNYSSEDLNWLVEQKYTVKQISMIYKVPVNTVELWQKKDLTASFTEATEIQPEKENVQETVFQMVNEGKSPMEIHHLLGVKHPGMMGKIRSARTKLAAHPEKEQNAIDEKSQSTSLIEEGEFELSLCEQPRELDLSGFCWVSDLRAGVGSLSLADDMIRLRKDMVVFCSSLQFSAERGDVGLRGVGKQIAIRSSVTGNKVSKQGNNRSGIVIKSLRKKLVELDLLSTQSFKVIVDSPDLIVGELIS